MRECRHCREWLRGDRVKLGARCPRCRQPLYERAERDLELDPDKPRCAVHPGRSALGPCAECGRLLCLVCRTRWYGKSLCLSCCQRARAGRDRGTADAWAHSRQAGLSLVLSLGGWIMVVLGAVALIAAQEAQPNARLATLGGLTTLASVLPAVFALGMAMAAIRTRGSSMVNATLGLVLAGIQLGLMTGFLVLNAWHY